MPNDALLRALYQRTPTDSGPQLRPASEPFDIPLEQLTPRSLFAAGGPMPAVRGMAPTQMMHTIRGGQMAGALPQGVMQDEMSSLFSSVPVGMAKNQGYQGSILGQPVFEPMEMGGMVRRLLPLDRAGRIPPNGSVPITTRSQ